jgi:RNA polymerase sigma-70 factor (ECF subfamily)
MTDEHFRALFADNFDDVWRFARRRTLTAEEADDVSSETFAVAWRRRDDLPPGAARLWLFGVARLVLANLQRESRRRARLQLRLAGFRPEPQPAPQVDDAVWQSLATLSAADRDLLLMRAWDALDVPQIAELLGIGPATVSSRLHKARKRLRRELDRRDPGWSGQVLSESPGERSRHHDRP